MRKWGLALALAAERARSAAACRRGNIADVQFTPPQGDYKLLVLRPDVTVGSLTTGGMVEPRADWTEQARAQHRRSASRAAGGARRQGHRSSSTATSLPGVTAQELADVERLNFAVDQSIVLHKYLGDYLPTKRGKGLDWTLGDDAVRLGQKTGYDYALFLHAEDQVASGGRDRARRARARRLLRRLLRAQCRRRSSSSIMPRWSTSRPARWCGSTSSRREARCPASSSATCARPQGAAQMVERLLGRMKPGKEPKGASWRRAAGTH